MPSTLVINNFFQDTELAQNDVKLTKSYFKCFGFLGVFPWCLQTKSVRWKIFSTCYIFVLLILFLLGATCTMLRRIQFAYKYMETPQIVGDFLEYLLQISFMSLILCGVIRSSKAWKLIFVDLAQTDNILESIGISIKFQTAFHILKIILWQVVFLAINVFTVYCWSVRLQLVYCYLFLRIVHFYQLLVVIFIYELMNAVRRRYNCLSTEITKLYSNCNRKMIDNDVSDFKLIYGLLSDIVERVSTTLGPYIFLILCCLLMNLLNSLNWYLFDFEQNIPKFQTGRRICHFLLDPLSFCICLAGIVMSCDRVERCGQDIVRTCYKLQGQMDKNPLREELVLLTKYVEGLSPKISAWGFFQVNQRLLCGLFATFATYLIIILQFRKV